MRHALLFVALISATTAIAREPADTHTWPERRHAELAGHYSGTIRDFRKTGGACEYLHAELDLRYDGSGKEARRDYSLVLTCPADPTLTPRQLRSGWWVDKMGDSCLILRPAAGHPVNQIPEKLYGFRIDEDGRTLRQDGHSCEAVDERDDPAILVRVSVGKGAD
jgi:hypothetical protein